MSTGCHSGAIWIEASDNVSIRDVYTITIMRKLSINRRIISREAKTKFSDVIG